MLLFVLHGLADVVCGCQQLMTLQKLVALKQGAMTEVTVSSVFQKSCYVLLRAAHFFSP